MDGKSKDNDRSWELQSWAKVLGHFCIYRAFFFFMRKKPLPHPTNNVGRVYREFFSECQHCVGWGEGKLQENVEKDAQLMFCNGTQKLQKIMSATSLSQGLLCRILVEFFLCVILPLDF